MTLSTQSCDTNGWGVKLFYMTYQLAEINVAKAKAEMDDPLMHGFVSRLDEINALAEDSPGFVWRLKDESGDATELRYFDDPLVIVNMSVWEDVASLKHYTYNTMHVEVFKQRKQWFELFGKPHFVMWWIPAGHVPSAQEAQEKLEYIHTNGPSADAFNFSKTFDPPQAEPAGTLD